MCIQRFCRVFTAQTSKSIEVHCLQSLPLCVIKWLCAVFLRYRLYVISHFAFPLCASLIIVFQWSALAFDMQTPKILAASQINCFS